VQKIIVLDRDGVINVDSDAYIKSADEWIPEAGSIEAIKALKKAGWIVAIATNQSGIRRGYYGRKQLSEMHQKLQCLLGDDGGDGVDWISYAPYLDEDKSTARKPNVGMLTAIEQRFGLSLAGMPMVGDTLADMQVALAKNMQPYLVTTGKGLRTLESNKALLSDVPAYHNLQNAVEAILK
jgi:D-glycero-D-manno-heptose 1,7-bisphosphate phosphatase